MKKQIERINELLFELRKRTGMAISQLRNEKIRQEVLHVARTLNLVQEEIQLYHDIRTRVSNKSMALQILCGYDTYDHYIGDFAAEMTAQGAIECREMYREVYKLIKHLPE